MSNILAVVLFIMGFVLILKGAGFLVDSAVALANKAKIPPIVVGATIVAIATTFPETTVSIVSSLKGLESIGVSTAVGSMVCNFTIVLGVAFLFLPSKIEPESFFSKAVYFCVCVLALLIFGIDGRIGFIEALALLMVLSVFVVINCVEASKCKVKKDLNEITESWLKVIIEFIISALSIGLGAMVLVNNVDVISSMLGLNNSVVSFVVIAVGTNIPELVTTITSIKMKNPEIGVGNIFGASIIDCTLLIACSSFASSNGGIFISKGILFLTVPVLFIITAVITVPIVKNSRSNRLQGLALIILYLIYTYLVIRLS
ncbi:MAG: sodium:calcium antiporter [Clostridia bacterium]|nr:sodium:calcium antiporter [Clostridia bacterium]